MPRHPAVTLAFAVTALGLLCFACAPLLAWLLRPGPDAQGTNAAPLWVVLTVLGTLLCSTGAIFALVGALAARRQGVRADVVGCAMLVVTALIFWVFFATMGQDSDAPLETKRALVIGCGLVELAALIILAARPGARGPHEVAPPHEAARD